MKPEITKRNLTYFVAPIASNDVWMRNISQIIQRIHLFNGKKIVAIATGGPMAPAEYVKRCFDNLGVTFLFFPNDAGLRESVAFYPMMDMIQSTDPHEATFYAHAKGVSQGTSNPVTSWRNSMYHYLLDDPTNIMRALENHSCVGCFRQFNHWDGVPFGISGVPWHYAGTFFWYRHDAVFSNPNWRQRIMNGTHTSEAYIGSVIPYESSCCVYQDNPDNSYYSKQPEQWPDQANYKECLAGYPGDAVTKCFRATSDKPSMTLVYLCNLENSFHLQCADTFLESYRSNPPGYDHETTIVFNCGPASESQKEKFRFMPNVKFYEHDDSGWDIGGYIAASKHIHTDIAVYFGTASFVQHAGYMARMVEAYKKHGVGFYGSLGTYEVRPHLVTSGFWCDPSFVATYPVPVNTKPERYEFEHGRDALWRRVARQGLPAMLVTWDGEYEWLDWRRPENIYRRGDQSNCLTFYKHSAIFGTADSELRKILSGHADVLTDPEFQVGQSGWNVRV